MPRAFGSPKDGGGQRPPEPKRRSTCKAGASSFGAGDEARTRFPASHEWLFAIRRNPASPRIECASGAGGGSAFKHTSFIPEKNPNLTVGDFFWSGRRGSNSLPPPWQGGALPDELRPRNMEYHTKADAKCQVFFCFFRANRVFYGAASASSVSVSSSSGGSCH